MDPKLFVLLAIIPFSYTVGATTGFGSAIIALTLALHLYPLDFIIPVIVPLNLVICLYLVIRHRTGVDRSLLKRKVLPFTLSGMPIGLVIFHVVQTEALKFWFGLFVVGLAVFELIRLTRANGEVAGKPLSQAQSIFWLFGGGIVQGLWVSGGPLIAYWAGRSIPNKREFRSTLSALWLILNMILFFSHVATGGINLQTLKFSALLIPFQACGIALGEYIHGRLPERAFRMLVYVVLVFAGASVLLRS